jgi:predicted amidohydrolase YtcJ
VFAQDKSGHQGVLNSVLLKTLNITKDSPNPEGEALWRRRAQQRQLFMGNQQEAGCCGRWAVAAACVLQPRA